MKNHYVFSLVLAAAMLSACSNDPIDTAQGGGSSIVPGADAYISLSINLPTTSGSTRANDVFDDGEDDKSEYAVKDGLLLILTGPDEANATVQSAYYLNNLSWEGNSAEQITTTAKKTQQIQQPSVNNGENIYALVVLNAASQDLNNENVIGLKYKELPQLPNAFNANDGLYMSNAPVAGQVGGKTATTAPTSVTTLVTIAPNKIYRTPTEASNNTAADIYVERAAAKIQVSGKTEDNKGTLTGNTDMHYKLIGWAVDNYNTTSYAVREFDNTWLSYSSANLTNNETNYRFVSGDAIANNVYRTYWGKDVNYNVDNANSDVKLTKVSYTVNNNTVTNIIPDGSETSMGSYVYVHENTFDVEHQSKDNTTRVIIKVNFNEGKDFITDELDGTDIIYPDKDAKAVSDALAATGATSKVQAWANDYLKPNSVINDIYTVSWVNTENPAQNNTLHAGIIVPTITIDESKVTDLLKESEGETFAKAKAAFDALGLNTNGHVYNLYLGGDAYYYTTLIKHFGDVETPFVAQEGTTYGTGETAEKNYLGRYGVLRNNWYKLTVNSISNIGSPTIPEITTDDNDASDDRYISVSINILPWAVRDQGVDL